MRVEVRPEQLVNGAVQGNVVGLHHLTCLAGPVEGSLLGSSCGREL